MNEPLPYRIEVSGEARRSLNSLPAKVIGAVIEFITGPIAENPHRLSKPLTHELDRYRSARRGDYRVLIRIDEPAHLVIIVRIDHRSDIFRSR